PVKPPRIATPVVSLASVELSRPPFVTVLFESIVTAVCPAVTLTEPPDAMVTLPAEPPFAVEVDTGVEVEFVIGGASAALAFFAPLTNASATPARWMPLMRMPLVPPGAGAAREPLRTGLAHRTFGAQQEPAALSPLGRRPPGDAPNWHAGFA